MVASRIMYNKMMAFLDKLIRLQSVSKILEMFFTGRKLSKFVLGQANNIVFVYELARKLWMEVNPWMPKEKCVVVHNSIPDTLFKPCNLRKELGIKETTPVIAFTGRVTKSKGCETIVKALGLIKNINFAMVFIGACKPKGYSARLLSLAECLGIKDKLYFYGFTDKARGLIAEADIGLSPSIVREACPLSPMEFMKLGKSIIATNNGAQSEYIDHGKNGILVSPGNVEQLSTAIGILLENVGLRNQIGNKARAYFNENLEYSIFLGKMLAVYKQQKL